MACEINSGDELVATEMIFAGVLLELKPEEAVALLSALVFQVCHSRLPTGLYFPFNAWPDRNLKLGGPQPHWRRNHVDHTILLTRQAVQLPYCISPEKWSVQSPQVNGP